MTACGRGRRPRLQLMTADSVEAGKHTKKQMPISEIFGVFSCVAWAQLEASAGV